MKKFFVFLIITIGCLALTSYTTAVIQGQEGYEFDYENMHYVGDDIDDTPIDIYEAGRSADPPIGHIVLCPGTGSHCAFVMTVNNFTFGVAGKKLSGSPNYVIVIH